MEDGRHIRTRLLVAADGARSRMRSLARLRTVQWMYNQKGLVATVRTAEPHATAWQRFLPAGPLALLPVRDGYSNIVWSTSPTHAPELEASTSVGFVAAVNEVIAAQITAAEWLEPGYFDKRAWILWQLQKRDTSCGMAIGIIAPGVCTRQCAAAEHRNLHLIALMADDLR